MKNETQIAIPQLLTLGEDAADGAKEHGAGIGLLRYKEPRLREVVAAAVLARDNHEIGKQALRQFTAALGATRDEARQFAMLARDLLKPTLGNQYSEAWDPTGLVGSLEIPKNADDLQPVMQSFGAFFTTNAGLEVAGRNVTAARSQELFTGLSDGRSAVNSQATEVKKLLIERDAKVTALRRAIRGLIDELADLIDPLDPRWLSFGLNMPGADERPDVPEKVRAVLIGNAAGIVKWDVTPRALYYRLWKKVIGVDQDPVNVGSPADANFTLQEIPPNATVELAVSAVNNGGESGRSDTITIVTH